MTNTRKSHVGKSINEKNNYKNILNRQQKEDPTYELNESLPTDSVIADDQNKSVLTEPILKPYTKQRFYISKDAVPGIIIFVITTILFLFGITLNRDIGILEERTKNAEKERNKINDTLARYNDEIINIKIILGIMKYKK